jgi:exosortase
MAALFWPNLRRLWEKTNPIYGEANWGHSICVPIIGLYYLYLNRDELLRARVQTAWSGLIFLLGGILIYVYGIWPGQNDFVKDFGMVVTLFGVVLLLTGWQVMKIAWFPIAFLVCALPWPGLVYSWVAGPLQELAARAAVETLQFTGVAAARAGTKIIMEGADGAVRTLNVAEACAGMRSLMTFISVGAAIAFLSSRPLWQKFLITLSAIPIAIFCNVMRVSGQGLLDRYWSQEVSEGFAHGFVGLVMLIPAFFMLLLVCWILDHLFIEEAEGKTPGRKARPVEAVVEVPRKPVAVPAPASGAVVAKATTPAVPAAPAAPRAPVAAQTPPRPGVAARPPAGAKIPPPPGTKGAVGSPTRTAGPAGAAARPPAPRRPSAPGITPPKKEGQ